MLRVQTALETLNLQINDAKTYLLPYEETENLTVDIRLGDADYILRSNAPNTDTYRVGEETLFRVWSEVMDFPERADRTKFSYCVTRFAEFEYEDPVSEVLSKLPEMPHVSDHTSRYLREYLGNPQVMNAVNPFLKGRNNQFVWQEYRLATLYWHSEDLSDAQLTFVRRKAGSQDTFLPSRHVFLRALAKHGSKEDAQEMQTRAESAGGPELLRGLIIAAAESGYLRAKNIREMARDDQEARRLVEFIASRSWKVPDLSF